MARKKFSCDFETTTDPEDCRVWAYGWMEVGKETNYKIGNSMDEFMQWVVKVQADLFFHNQKFDGSFIVNWLFKNGYTYSEDGEPNTFKTVISNMGSWYIIDISFGYKGKKKLHTVIYDSLKKLPFPVKKIAKDFKLELKKGEIDYHKPRPVGYKLTEEEYDYVKNDIWIIAKALHIQFNQGLDRITNGSDSLKGFKSIISTKQFERFFPVFSLELDSDIRRAYRGGFTWLNERFKEKDIGEGIVFDVNSLYPSQMYSRSLPHGMPIYFDGQYKEDQDYPLYIQHIRCEFEIKENRIPTIQIKKNLMFKDNEYLKSSDGDIVDLYVTNIDLELIKEHYHLYDVEYVNGWKFKQKVGIFNQFIDKWTYVKTHETGAKKLLAKLMLNSLYGKFASNPNVTGKIPYLKEDGALGFRLGDEEFKDPIYTPMGVFITSWARYTTITTAQKCYDRIIYCDTDSIHLTGVDIPEAISDIVDDKKLGFWAWEGTFKRAKYLRQKTYMYEMYMKKVDGKLEPCEPHEHTDLKTDVKCAGMTDSIKKKVTFENFRKGFTSKGKLLQKQVSGGVVLVDTEFTIK
jgi:hypothetical protein